METIIQQIVAEVVAKILAVFEEKGIESSEQAIEDLTPTSHEMVLKILSAVIREMNESLEIEAKAQRRKDGITIKQRGVGRDYETKLGLLHYERTYFQMADGSYVYLIDHLIGVEPYTRISNGLIASILQGATEQSYRGAIESSNQNLSKQTVHNRLIAVEEVATEVVRVKETPKTLDIFADEDHVHLTPKGGAIVPLVTITEGIDTSDPKRHKTINPLHMTGYGISTDAFKENILAVLYERYDLDQVETIYIHADGGVWIQSLKDLLPNAKMVMDGFHLEKYLKSFLQLEGAKEYASRIRRSIRENNIEAFSRYGTEIYQKQTTEASRDKAQQFLNYAAGHWDAIALRMSGSVCGSCTEPLVSHVLSDRLSRDPISWSREGLRKMSMLMAYTKNGGVVNAEHVRVHADRKEKARFAENGFAVYKAYADKQIGTVLSQHCNWDIFEPVHSYTPGKIDGTSMLLKALGTNHSPASIS